MTTVTEKNLILLGAPGAGKGTQSQRLCAEYAIPQISTGDILRAARREGTPLGKKAEGFMNAGQLVPDEVVIGLVEERLRLADTKNGFVLDGFPRTIPQAEALNQVLETLRRAPLRVVAVDVPEPTLLERLSGRISCPKDGATYHRHLTPPKQDGVCDICGTALIERADDRREAIAARLAEYKEKTAPLVAYYEKRGLLRRVDGTGQPSDVYAAIVKQIENS